MSTIVTTNGKPFSMSQHAELARLIFKRFGEDLDNATAAWRRLFQNDTTPCDFEALVCYPEHTPSCDGWCQDPAQEHDYHAAVRAIASPR